MSKFLCRIFHIKYFNAVAFYSNRSWDAKCSKCNHIHEMNA